ncbi:MAG: ABC transporter ATP-binding protein [Pseudomonadota bacterium]|nr:ABC transporter ATP-binding protein [Pseudomonadota bacterium]
MTGAARGKVEATGLSWAAAPGQPILEDVSFSLAAGRTMGVVGANGAGKSTLLRLLYRYYRPSAGTVTLDGETLSDMPARRVARHIAAVLQEQPTDFALTVREIVALGRAPHRRGFTNGGERDARIVDEVLNRLDLHRFAPRAFGTLSGGEKQRVMVARALAQEPEVLILDEPTNHLDIRHQLEVLGLVRGLGITVVTSLHDLNLTVDLCDDVLVLHRGRAIAFGPPDEALTPENVSRAFSVTARLERIQPSETPHFTFHLTDLERN